MNNILSSLILLTIIFNVILIFFDELSLSIITISSILCFLLCYLKNQFLTYKCKNKIKLAQSDIYVAPFEVIRTRGAFATKDYVIFEEGFYNELDDKKRRAIVFHEKYHIKHKHSIIKCLFWCVFLWNGLCLMSNQHGLYDILLLILWYATYFIFMCYSEYNADAYSADENNVEDIISVLEYLKKDYENIRQTNSIYFFINQMPSLESRINRLYTKRGHSV
ncbi:MAG: M48 family metalloprotease [Oscillospiraceae bacterium]|nr:M48 family metalloprotease [Oscillospiraceae bacterium]